MKEERFETVIDASSRFSVFNFREIVKYRDLIVLFVRKEFVAKYKQTILGPAWAIIQPLLTTVVFTVVFGNLAKLSTDGVPPFLFYMCGNVAWAYFSGCLQETSNVFVANAPILGKVYFPRLVMPISIVFSHLISYVIQALFFLVFLAIYCFIPSAEIHPNIYVLMTPALVLEMALLGLGFGVIVSAVTTRYRDLTMLVSFGVQLWMYATPIAYSVDIIPARFIGLYMLNPMTPIIQTYRYAFLGVGQFHLNYYLISWGITLLVLFVGIVLFNRVEKTFMDTV